jgi:hypothetical protein
MAWRLTDLSIRGGVALSCITLFAAASSDPHGPAVPDASFIFGGRIITADGGPVEGLHVLAADARGTYEAIMDSSGTFVGSFPAVPTSRVSLRIYSDSSAPRYHTSAITLGSGIPSVSTRVILLPQRWRIRGGPYDGREVAIDPRRATTRYGEGTGYWGVTRRGRSIGRAVSWVVDSFPIRVAFRRERRDPYVSASDSARFWEVARQLEQLIGRRLFRPSTWEEIDRGADGILVTVNRGMSSAGKTYITYDQSGRIYEALVTVSQHDYLGQSRIASHELLHAIGFGHTGAWQSVMGPSASGVNAPTVEDIAYAQLFYAISQLQREQEAQFGILESAR